MGKKMGKVSAAKLSEGRYARGKIVSFLSCSYHDISGDLESFVFPEGSLNDRFTRANIRVRPILIGDGTALTSRYVFEASRMVYTANRG